MGHRCLQVAKDKIKRKWFEAVNGADVAEIRRHSAARKRARK